MTGDPLLISARTYAPGDLITPYRPAPLAPRPPINVSDAPRPREETAPRPRSALLPPADAWSRMLAAALAEVLIGARPARQLNRWLEPDVYARVARRAGLAVRMRGRPVGQSRARVLGLRVSEPVGEDHEVAALVHDGERFRAVAMRIRRTGDRWHVIAAEVG